MIFRKQHISTCYDLLFRFPLARKYYKGKIKGKNYQNFEVLVLDNGLLQCEFTNELRNYREDIQIICNHIADKNKNYFLSHNTYI